MTAGDGRDRRRGSLPAASGLAVAGGLLVILEGAYFVLRGGPALYPVSPAGPSFSIPTLGGVAIAEGLLLLLGGLVLGAYPERPRVIGVGILTFGLLSLGVGGGFWVGAFLAYVAGLLAIFATPPTRSTHEAAPAVVHGETGAAGRREATPDPGPDG